MTDGILKECEDKQILVKEGEYRHLYITSFLNKNTIKSHIAM